MENPDQVQDVYQGWVELQRIDDAYLTDLIKDCACKLGIGNGAC